MSGIRCWFSAFSAVVALVAFHGVSKASDAEHDKALFRTVVKNRGGDYLPADRLAIAKSALAYWKHFDSRLPRNSPDDAEWLATEMMATDGKRQMQAAHSAQFARRELVTETGRCVSFAEQLVQVIGTDTTDELYLWLKAIPCYDGGDTLIYLQRAGLSDGSSDGAFKANSFSIVASAISGGIANAIYREHATTRR